MGRGRSPGAKGCLQLLWSSPLSTIKLKGGLGTAVGQVKGVCVCVCARTCVCIRDVMKQVSTVMKPRF